MKQQYPLHISGWQPFEAVWQEHVCPGQFHQWVFYAPDIQRACQYAAETLQREYDNSITLRKVARL